MALRPTLSSVALFGLLAGTASAQTFTLTTARPLDTRSLSAAAAPAAFPAGRDFATEVLGDPWDFEQATDYTLQYSLDIDPFRSAWAGVPQMVDGVFTGTSQSRWPVVNLLFEGRNYAADGVDGLVINQAFKNGVRFPIDANRFRRLSFRVRRGATPADWMQVRWLNTPYRSADASGAKYFFASGYNDLSKRYANQMPATRLSGWVIYKVDLDTFDGAALQYGIPWQATMRHVEIVLGGDPAHDGSRIELDWVRLTERGVALVDLQFTGFGGRVNVTARHQETGDVVQVLPDDGTNATTFADNTTFRWDYGFLPPGTWVITAERNSTRVTQTLVVDAPPVIHVLDPDVSGGRDFARTILGDAWDMTNPQDISRSGRLGNITNATFDDNGLTATNVNGDPFVALVDDAIFPVGRELQVPADDYYRFTFTLEYLENKELPGPLALSPEWGAVYRVIWRGLDAGRGGPYTDSKAVMMLDGGPHTFSMDLRQLTLTGPGGEPGVEPNPPTLWTGALGTLRIDPNEAGRPRPFRLSNVKLAADDEPNGSGFFLVRWQVADATFTRAVADAAGADARVTLFYDVDPDPAGRMPIPGASNLPAAQGQFAWNVAALAPGTYWVFAQVADAAGNSQLRPSTGPVRVRAGLVAPTDTNGNGLADAWEARYGVSSPDADDDGDGISNLDEYRMGTDPRLSNRWVLPEGATGFFRQRLAMANPNPEDAALTITYLRENAPPVVRDYTVAGHSRVTVDVNSVAHLADQAVSTVVTAQQGGVVVERTMAWGDQLQGGHTGKALSQPHTKWYLAEGHAGGFDTFVLLANANTEPTAAQVDFLLEGGAPVSRSYTLPPTSRTTINTKMIAPLVGQAFSTTVQSVLPITVERAMYFSTPHTPWDGGHGAAAVEAPSTEWFVAEGCTAGMFDMFLLLANPGAQATTATVRYLLPGGGVVTKAYDLPAQSRTTVWVDTVPGLGDTDVSASITAPLPIIVERAMYWGNGEWTDGHASAGVTSTGTRWALAEGEHGGSRGYVSYVLLANPGQQAARVRVTLLRRAGLSPLSMDVEVPANARLTLSSAQFPLADGEQFGIFADSLNGVPIVVERAMYWNGGGRFWGSGTNETGFRLR